MHRRGTIASGVLEGVRDRHLTRLSHGEVMAMRKRDARPPRGPGHYSEDGGWWWDDDQHRWFHTSGQEDVLEIEAEDVSGLSPLRSMLQTLTGGWFTLYSRFAGRARSADPRWPTYLIEGATFPVIRGEPLDHLQAQGAWVDTIEKQFREMHQQLVREGRRPTGHGRHWWSHVYRRPTLDWDTSPDGSPTPRAARSLEDDLGTRRELVPTDNIHLTCASFLSAVSRSGLRSQLAGRPRRRCCVVRGGVGGGRSTAS